MVDRQGPAAQFCLHRVLSGNVTMDARFDAVIFDFDGVIADSMPLQAAAWEHAVGQVLGASSAHGNRQQIRAALLRNLYRGHAGPRMFEGIRLSPERTVALRAAKNEAWKERWSEVPLVPGAEEHIDRLADTFTLSVATSAPRAYVDEVLDRSIRDRFAEVLTDADVGAPKPSPDLLHAIAERTGVPLRATCMVGDTATDLHMAQAAGCAAFVAFRVHLPRTDGGFIAEANIDTWIELSNWLVSEATP